MHILPAKYPKVEVGTPTSKIPEKSRQPNRKINFISRGTKQASNLIGRIFAGTEKINMLLILLIILILVFGFGGYRRGPGLGYYGGGGITLLLTIVLILLFLKVI